MEIALPFFVGYLMVLAIGHIIIDPFLIGRERKPYTATLYLLELLTVTGIVLFVGRFWGWW